MLFNTGSGGMTSGGVVFLQAETSRIIIQMYLIFMCKQFICLTTQDKNNFLTLPSNQPKTSVMKRFSFISLQILIYIIAATVSVMLVFCDSATEKQFIHVQGPDLVLD